MSNDIPLRLLLLCHMTERPNYKQMVFIQNIVCLNSYTQYYQNEYLLDLIYFYNDNDNFQILFKLPDGLYLLFDGLLINHFTYNVIITFGDDYYNIKNNDKSFISLQKKINL